MLNTLYNEYVSQEELECEAMIESAEIEVLKTANALRAICEKAALDIREAELKCILESGDADDLVMLYQEADEKTAEKKDGLLKKIWDAIAKFFKKIKDFFVGKKEGAPSNDDEVEVDSGIHGFLTRVKGWCLDIASAIKSWVVDHKKLTGLLVGGAAALGTLGIFKVLKKNDNGTVDTDVSTIETGKFQKIKGALFNKTVNDAEDGVDSITDAVDSIKDKGGDTEEMSKISSVITSIGSAIKNAISKFWSFVTGKSRAEGKEDAARDGASGAMASTFDSDETKAATKERMIQRIMKEKHCTRQNAEHHLQKRLNAQKKKDEDNAKARQNKVTDARNQRHINKKSKREEYAEKVAKIKEDLAGLRHGQSLGVVKDGEIRAKENQLAQMEKKLKEAQAKMESAYEDALLYDASHSRSFMEAVMADVEEDMYMAESFDDVDDFLGGLY